MTTYFDFFLYRRRVFDDLILSWIEQRLLTWDLVPIICEFTLYFTI